MTTPINLNKARKKKARADKEQRATENRAKFGRSKSEKVAEKTERDRSAKIVDLSKREK